MNTDFLIIGAGVIGLSIARALHKRGAKRITVVDRGTCGREASWAAAGMLAPNAETEVVDDFYRFCSASNALYPRFAEELKEETGVDIELRQTGTLELAFDEVSADHLNTKYILQRDARIDVESLSPLNILRFEPEISSRVIFGLHYPTDGHVENRKIVQALIAYARKNGIALLENTEWSDPPVTPAVKDREIFGQIVLATGAWSPYIKPIRGQMLAFRGSKGLLNKVIYGAGAYLVPRTDGRILVGATSEDVGFAKEVTRSAIRELTEAAIKTFPEMLNMPLIDSWSGFRPFAPDGLPVIGEIEGKFIATGHYRNGILLAPLTAEIVADRMINGTDSEYFSHFSPGRFVSVPSGVAGRGSSL